MQSTLENMSFVPTVQFEGSAIHALTPVLEIFEFVLDAHVFIQRMIADPDKVVESIASVGVKSHALCGGDQWS